MQLTTGVGRAVPHRWQGCGRLRQDTSTRAALDAAAALAGAGQPITADVVREVLKDVYNPEIPINIVDLGLIYGLAVTGRADRRSDVDVQMTLTAPGCGMGQIAASLA